MHIFFSRIRDLNEEIQNYIQLFSESPADQCFISCVSKDHAFRVYGIVNSLDVPYKVKFVSEPKRPEVIKEPGQIPMIVPSQGYIHGVELFKGDMDFAS